LFYLVTFFFLIRNPLVKLFINFFGLFYLLRYYFVFFLFKRIGILKYIDIGWLENYGGKGIFNTIGSLGAYQDILNLTWVKGIIIGVTFFFILSFIIIM